jgi:hypothetical protein
VFLKLRTEYPLVAVDVIVAVVDVFATSKRVAGELVPIPTLPLESMRIRSVEAVIKLIKLLAEEPPT